MATRTITTKLAIEGEAEYRAAIKNVNAELSLHKSELKKVEAQYKESANGLTALEAKETALKEILSDLTAKHAEHTAMLEKAKKAQRQYAEQAEQVKAKLDALKTSTGASADEDEKLTKELANAERKMKEAANSVIYYQKQINNTERDQADFGSELQKTERYLDEARNSTDQCATSIDKYGKEVKRAKENSEELGDKSKKAINTLASALAAAGVAKAIQEIAEAIKECVDASIEFESAMAGVFKTVDGTDTQMEAISVGIKKMSTEIPAATTEIAAVAETAGQLGIATNDVLSFTRVMLDLGESTNLTAKEAASALAKFANITGTAAADYERLGSAIVALGNNFATTEAEITEMATRLASAGTLAGLTESDIMALAAAMSSVGIEAEAGGTAMTQTLTAVEKAVSKGGKDLEDFARIAGMSASEFKTAWENDAITAIQAFISGLGKLDEQGESATLILDELGLSGIRQSNMLKSLALASNTLTSAVGLANQAWAENTALTNEANKRYETTESKLAMMNNAFTNVKAAIGDALTPALRELADAGTDAFSWSADFIEQNPWLVQATIGLVTTFELLAAGALVYANAAKIAAAATGIFQAAVTALSAHPVFLAITAITGLAVAASSFIASANEAGEANRDLIDSLEESRKAYKETQAALSEQKDNTLATATAIESLAEKEHKTTAEKETLLALVKQLNEEVPGLNLAYNDLDDTLNMTIEDIQRMALAQAEQEEREAAVQRYSELYIEQRRILDDLASAEDRLKEAEVAKNEMVQNGTYWMVGYESQSQAVDAALSEAAKSVSELTKEQDINTKAMAEANEAYGDLQSAVENASEQTDEMKKAAEISTKALEAMGDTADDLSGVTKSLAGAQDTLTAALREQKEQGSLNIDTALDLIDAGYASALSIDTETGAIILNKAAYIDLTRTKIEAQIKSIEVQQESINSALAMKDEALMATELGKAYLTAADARDALEGQQKSYDAQKNALAALEKSLNSYSFASASAARTSAASSKKIKTQAEKDLAKFKEIKAELDHQKTMDELDEKEYYARLAQYRDQYLTDNDNLDDYRKITEEIYKYDQKLAEEEDKLWEEQTKSLVSELEGRVKSVLDQQDKMFKDLAGYGDLFTIEEDRMSLENIQEQIDALNAYEEALTGLKGRDISDSLMSEVLEMDVDEATQYAQQLISMTEEQWEGYNGLWEEKQRRAAEIAAQFYQDQLDALKTEYNDKLGETLSGLTDTAFSSGQDTAQGLIDGLSAKEKELYSKAQSIADEMSRILSSAYAGSERVDGSHAGGLPYVPYDGYIAELHQGERVLTAKEAQEYITRAIPSNFDEPASRSQSDAGAMLAQAVNAFGTIASANGGTYRIEIPLNIDGREFYRVSIDDLRSVMKSSPEVTSDK